MEKRQNKAELFGTIISDFNSLIENMSYDDMYTENIFNIVKKYISYDFAGLYFSDFDESVVNIFNVSLPKNNISIDLTSEIRDKFFDKMEKVKQINDIQCNLINGDIAEKSNVTMDSFKTFNIYTFKYSEHLSGGFCLALKKKLTAKEQEALAILLKEIEIFAKVRYKFNEQSKRPLLDPMTGIYNRPAFNEFFELEFHKARRYIYNFTLALLDIDNMNEINEKYGEKFGDFVITELATVLKHVFRKTDPVYRFEGDSIMILLPFTPITKALIPIERLRSAISKYSFAKGDNCIFITVSVGMCANYSKFEEPNQLLEGVVTSLERAKARGVNTVDIFE